jgi:ATP-dependent helicase/nuclease subunit A
VVELASLRPRIDVELASLGVVTRPDDRSRDNATMRVLEAVGNALDDPQGRWLFARTHTDVHAEWALTSAGESGIERIAIDRSFVADGTRWIVDFKTSRHQGGDVEAFLATEQARHAPQLERYARVLKRQDSLPVMLALYYPALRALRSWRFAG